MIFFLEINLDIDLLDRSIVINYDVEIISYDLTSELPLILSNVFISKINKQMWKFIVPLKQTRYTLKVKKKILG